MSKPKKHVHWWEAKAYRAVGIDRKVSFHATAECSCGKTLSEDELTRRLNACERMKRVRYKKVGYADPAQLIVGGEFVAKPNKFVSAEHTFPLYRKRRTR